MNSRSKLPWLILAVVIIVIGAYWGWRFSQRPSSEAGPTSTFALSEKMETATALAQLATPAPPITPTPEPTITPNIPSDAFPVATPKPRLVAVFTRPQPVIPSVLAFINETDAQLLVFLQGAEEPITILPSASAERQLAPGEYHYRVTGRTDNLDLLSDRVSLKSNERIEITIRVKDLATLAFENQTGSQLTITLAGVGEALTVPAKTTSSPRPLPPGNYTYTASSGGIAALTDKVTLKAGDALTIVIKPGDVFNAALSVENRTDYQLTVTLAGVSPPIVVAAGQTSSETPLLAGEYDYTVVTTPGNVSMSGHLSLGAGERKVLTIDVTMVASELSALVIENKTDFELVANLSGLPWTIKIPPHSASEEKKLPPGEYDYTVKATGGNIAPLSGHITLGRGMAHTLALELPPGSRAQVIIENRTGCTLQITLTGPEKLAVSVPANSDQEINIASGDYDYTAGACGASDRGRRNFSGQSTWTFGLY